MRSATPSAETRAAYAALARPSSDSHLERCLVIEELDDGTDEVRTLIRERKPRFTEYAP